MAATTCAVEGCTNEGHPQRCLYDGSDHHHGRIHYDCPRAERTHHGLSFRPGWHLMCPTHYDTLRDALRAVEAR